MEPEEPVSVGQGIRRSQIVSPLPFYITKSKFDFGFVAPIPPESKRASRTSAKSAEDGEQQV